MSKSKIEWTDETWNPVTGCTKVSAGCKHCYAERMWPRLKTGRPFIEVRLHPERLTKPLHWRKPRRVFVNSMSDLFHESVPFEFIAAVFGIMAATPQHTYQILTKRPERARAWFGWLESMPPINMGRTRLSGARIAINHAQRFIGHGLAGDSPWPLPNVWLGVSAENQETADERIPLLLECPSVVHFVSGEPLLGPIDFSRLPWRDGLFDARIGVVFYPSTGGMSGGRARLKWVIVGGESGPKARPMHPQWVRDIRDQCRAANVPFFLKQWGEWEHVAHTNSSVRWPTGMPAHGWSALHLRGTTAYNPDNPFNPFAAGHPGWSMMRRIGKRAAGRELDGRTWEEYPK